MPRTRLTHRQIESALPATSGQRYHLWDDVVRGLALRVTDSGHKSWIVMRRVRGEKRLTRITIGRFPDMPLDRARQEARPKVEDMDAGVNPLVQRKAEELEAERQSTARFETALERYLERVGDKLRSGRELRRIFKVYVGNDWASRQMHAITRRDVAALLDKIEENNGPAMATRTLDSVRAFFNWFARRDETFVNPVVRGMAPTRPKDVARSRTLTDDEIRALWVATDTVTPVIFGKYVRLLLLTAARRNEWASAQWREIAGTTLVIPQARYKTGVEHRLPLSEPAREIIKSLPRVGDYIITTTGDAPFSGFSKAKTRLDELMLAELKRLARERGADSGKVELANWRLHDLRRTARSLMARAGVRPDHAERVLGHVIRGIEGTYDRHHYEDEKHIALDALAKLIKQIVSGDNLTGTQPDPSRLVLVAN